MAGTSHKDVASVRLKPNLLKRLTALGGLSGNDLESRSSECRATAFPLYSTEKHCLV
jgi:hypothetical protein